MADVKTDASPVVNGRPRRVPVFDPSADRPSPNLEHHFRFTWVGFDLILVLAVYLTAHMAFRLDARMQVPATVVVRRIAS